MTRMLNFVFYILFLFCFYLFKHSFICGALLFASLFAIIILRQRQISKKTKMSAKERHQMFEDAKKRKESMPMEQKFTCVNCGAPLKAEYAVCEYCGMRSRQKNGRIGN